jgi:hypothetical protein
MVARGHWWAGLVLVILLIGAVHLGVPAIRGSILPIMSAGSTRLLITSAHPQRIRASLRYPVSRRNLQLALHTAMNKVGRLEHPGTLTIDRRRRRGIRYEDTAARSMRQLRDARRRHCGADPDIRVGQTVTLVFRPFMARRRTR